MESFLGLDLFASMEATGYIGLFAAVFLETALFLGAFLPADSLLFTAGVLASKGYFHIGFVITISLSAALLGDSVAYFFGSAIAPHIFQRGKTFFFKEKHIERARGFFERRGRYMFLFSRFLPGVRMLAPLLAGMRGMRYSRFLMYDGIGSSCWAVLFSVAGYYIGSVIPEAPRYLVFIVLGVVLLFSLPGIVYFAGNRDVRRHFRETIRRLVKGSGV